MNAAQILAELYERGVNVEPLPDGKLALSPEDRLTPELITRVRAAKPELLALFGRPAAPCPACAGRAFWRGSGPWICSRCHPPVTEPLEQVTLPGPEVAGWTRDVTPNAREPLLPDGVRQKIRAIEAEAYAAGWVPELLWNSGFWDSPRGLAAVLDDGDEIVEVAADAITVRKLRRDLLRFSRAH